MISTSHCAAKSVVVTGRARHLCYCLTPMRYAWDQFDAYFGPDRIGTLPSLALRPVMAAWPDGSATQHRVHSLSGYLSICCAEIACTISESTLVYPPVDTEFYDRASVVHGQSHFLVVSALVPYKRVDCPMMAARQAGVPLEIVGDGPERGRPRRSRQRRGVAGRRSDEEIHALY